MKENNIGGIAEKRLNDNLKTKHSELMPVAGKQTEDTRWEWQDQALYSEWFDGWKRFLVDNGYAIDKKHFDQKTKKLISEVTFLPGKMSCILNLDETQIPRDASSRAANHVSNNVMINPVLPRPGTKSTKCSGHETLILCVSADGEVLPPFVIFDTSAEIEENRKVRTDCLQNLPDVEGYFGGDHCRQYNTEFAVTLKGSMDKTLWPQYVKQTIYQCFPATAVEYEAKGFVSENRICIKVDGGPGKTDLFMLLELHEMGIDLFPGFPNGSGYNQECDDLYSDLKLAMYKQADAMESAYNRPLTAQDAGEILNGDDAVPSGGNFIVNGFETDVQCPPKPMSSVLTHGRVLKGWTHVGACPLTRASQQDTRLRSGDGSGNVAQQELLAIVAKHEAALEQMRAQGFSTTHVQDTRQTKISARIVERPVVAALVEDQLVAWMLKAKSHSAGNAFIAVGAKAMNGRVALRAEFERLMVAADVKKATQDKAWQERHATREEAEGIIATAPQPFSFAALTNDKMAKVLRGRGASASGNKAAMIEKWTTDLRSGEIDLPEEYPPIVVAEGYTYDDAARLRRQILRATEAKDKLEAEREQATSRAAPAVATTPASLLVPPVATTAVGRIPGFGSPTRRSPFAPAPVVQTRRTPSGGTALVLRDPHCSPVRPHQPRQDVPTHPIYDPQHPTAAPQWLFGLPT
jgi:hypothetical protein